MKRIFYFCMVLLTVSTAVGGENLMDNSGFERSDFGGWHNWNAFVGSTIQTNPAVAYEGEHYLSLEVDPEKFYGGFVQNLWQRDGITWGDTIEASAWVRTEHLIGQEAFLLLEFLDEDWVQAGRFESEHLTGTHGWTELKVRGTIPTKIAEPYLDKVHVVLSLSGRKNSGNVLFDNVSARRVGPGIIPGMDQ